MKSHEIRRSASLRFASRLNGNHSLCRARCTSAPAAVKAAPLHKRIRLQRSGCCWARSSLLLSCSNFRSRKSRWRARSSMERPGRSVDSTVSSCNSSVTLANARESSSVQPRLETKEKEMNDTAINIIPKPSSTVGSPCSILKLRGSLDMLREWLAIDRH